VTPHRYRLRVYYEDTDAGGVVYHAGYLRFAERARTEALRDAGVPHAELTREFGLIFMVRRIEMEYLRPARLDEALTVVTESRALGAATVSLSQDVWAEETLLVTLGIKLACVRRHDGRPGRIPARWRNVLAPAPSEGAGPRTEGMG
jgi:acyl-CoA thioester hydrolase